MPCRRLKGPWLWLARVVVWSAPGGLMLPPAVEQDLARRFGKEGLQPFALPRASHGA